MHLIVSSAVAVATFALMAIEPVRGQNLPSTIVGCPTVGCPGDSTGTTNAKCIVVDKTFNTIGLARIPVSSKALSGLSWTEGIAVLDSNHQRTFERDFYFGTPPHTNLTGTGACAVFFSYVSSLVRFRSASMEESQGKCQDAMSSACVDALIKRAVSVDVGGLGGAEACTKLQAAFSDNLDSACSSFATGGRWAGISVKPLSVAGTANLITAAQNLTSNCWPIVPKQYDLALVNSIQYPGNSLMQTLSDDLYSITPILTLFYPGNGSLITQAEAQMTCMKTVGPSEAANRTQSSGTENSSAKASRKPGIAALATTLILLVIFVF